MSLGTIRRNASVRKSLFDRCIVRKWMTENPATVLRMRRRRNTKRTRDEVKYLTRHQMEDIMWAVSQFPRMADENKIRLKALILTMCWTGLRISDATLLKVDAIRDGVLFEDAKGKD
jgi:integrase